MAENPKFFFLPQRYKRRAVERDRENEDEDRMEVREPVVILTDAEDAGFEERAMTLLVHGCARSTIS